MIVCSIDLNTDLQNRSAAKQLRYSLIEYMKSEEFSPTSDLTLDRLSKLFRQANIMDNASVVHVDSFQPGYPAENAIDSNPDTMWSTQWSPEIKKHPHEIVIDLGQEVEIKGFTYLSRQDGNQNGWIREYQFYISTDGKNWGKPVAKGAFSRDASLKKVMFYDALSVYSDSVAKARYIRFVAVSGFEDDPYTTIAELNIIID